VRIGSLLMVKNRISPCKIHIIRHMGTLVQMNIPRYGLQGAKMILD
jgi:hypothetical protein